MKKLIKLLAALAAAYCVYFVVVFSYKIAVYEFSGASARDTASMLERQRLAK